VDEKGFGGKMKSREIRKREEMVGWVERFGFFFLRMKILV
jgi:hypothetical protein